MLPVRVLLDHLVDFEYEGVVAEGAAHTLLVETELCRRDGLALGDLREVELELLVVTPLWRELAVVLDCGMETHTNTQRHRITHNGKERGKERQEKLVIYSLCMKLYAVMGVDWSCT